MNSVLPCHLFPTKLLKTVCCCYYLVFSLCGACVIWNNFSCVGYFLLSFISLPLFYFSFPVKFFSYEHQKRSFIRFHCWFGCFVTTRLDLINEGIFFMFFSENCIASNNVLLTSKKNWKTNSQIKSKHIEIVVRKCIYLSECINWIYLIRNCKIDASVYMLVLIKLNFPIIDALQIRFECKKGDNFFPFSK